ncbi:MAG: Gfo/Idh/MocA family oxidoreductase [Acidimicrobiales bacterium]
MGEPLTIGILGANSWIANAAVIPAINDCPNAVLGALGARSGPIGYLDVLSDPAVEAVYIALANGDHLEWVERAAAAGKHVLCEKPLAVSSAEARRMFEACDSAGVLLAEAYMTPFHPLSATLATLIDSKDLGTIRHVASQFTFPLALPETDAEINYRWRTEQGGGALLDVGIYCLDPIVRILGTEGLQIEVQTTYADTGIDLTTSVWLRSPSGITASVLVSFELPENQALQIDGTAGSLQVARPFTPGTDETTFGITRRDGTLDEYRAEGANCYERMINAFADSVRGSRPWPRSSADVLSTITLSELIADAGRERK